MKITERKPVRLNKRGKIIFANSLLEKTEIETIKTLASFGFDIETVIPTDIPKSKNPDILLDGTIWEIKNLTSTNSKTIKNKFRKAAKQSGGKAIFDLRNNKMGSAEIKKEIMKLFGQKGSMKRIIIIENDETMLDITCQKK